MPKLQTISKQVTKGSKQATDPSEQLEPIQNHPLAPYLGTFHDSAFFDDVVENIRARREEEKKQCTAEE